MAAIFDTFLYWILKLLTPYIATPYLDWMCSKKC